MCDLRRRIEPIGTGWLKDKPSRERKRRGRLLKSAAVAKLNWDAVVRFMLAVD